MIPFLLGPNGTAELHRIRDYGDSHIIKFTELKKMMEGLVEVPGDKKEHTCILPAKGDYDNVSVVTESGREEGKWPFPPFKVVYSVEEQPVATLRHMSASIVGVDSRLPSPECIEMVIKELGFRPLKECKVWINNEPVKCVNVLDFYGD